MNKVIEEEFITGERGWRVAVQWSEILSTVSGKTRRGQEYVPTSFSPPLTQLWRWKPPCLDSSVTTSAQQKYHIASLFLY